jgi:hypothetical protein
MESLKINNDGWMHASNQVFWGEIAPCEHVVQIYENDEAFLDLLSGYVTGGIKAGESVIVIATESHLKGLEERLDDFGYNRKHLISKKQYIPLDAEAMLAKFMVNGWPDENLFNHVVRELIMDAKRNGEVRAFGEMVAILWAKGHVGATVRLEQLWSKFCEQEALGLFCAYPQSGFTQDATESVMHICGAHSKMVSAGKGKADVFYRNVPQSNPF